MYNAISTAKNSSGKASTIPRMHFKIRKVQTWSCLLGYKHLRFVCISQRVCYHLEHSSMLNTVSSLNMLMLCFPGEVLRHISTDLCPISLLVVLSRACSWKLYFICAVLCERTIDNKMERETL